MDRRAFLTNTALTAAAISSYGMMACNRLKSEDKLFLLRYDTEWWGEESEMEGFFEKLIEVHRANSIPATFFCTGNTLNNRTEVFKAFYNEVKHDALFDFQDHSFNHIGLCKKGGQGLTFEELKSDYEKSFSIHNEVFEKMPVGISMCGTPGESYKAFDFNEKTKAEFEMLANLGMKMINTYLLELDGSKEFCNYSSLGHPEIMGFPSGYSDTDWGWKNKETKGPAYILDEIKMRSDNNEHMPLMLHDWVAWQHAEDKELTHVKMFADQARKCNYKLVTHIECYEDKRIWKTTT